MWKPGTEKPNNSVSSSSSKKKRKNASKPTKLDIGFDDDGGTRKTSTTPKGSSSATPRKCLSGGTMNMRFMKRRKDAITNSSNGGDAEKKQPRPRSKSPSRSKMEEDDAMNIDETDDDVSRDDNYINGSKYARATSVDMFGIGASLIGRQSFGGFNEPIERIWKDSKASMENRGVTDRPGQKLSDEELLLRYKEMTHQRGNADGAKGVGNFDKKNKSKRRR